MSAERDFANFEPGDSILELGGSVIPTMASFARIDLNTASQESLVASLGQLVGAYGKNKVLRENESPAGLSIEQAAEWVDDSGVQKALQRTLWSPDEVAFTSLNAIIATGAVANWQDRSAKHLTNLAQPQHGKAELPKVYLALGNRIMNTSTELSNRYVQVFMRDRLADPNEFTYGNSFIRSELKHAGLLVDTTSYNTEKGDEIAAKFAGEHPELWTPNSTIGFARVANAGIQLAMQFRKAIRSQQGLEYFDSQESPQVVVITDTLQVAANTEQLEDPVHFQSPYTALRQLAQTARMLEEAGVTRSAAVA